MLRENPLRRVHERAEASFLPYGPLVEIVESYGRPEVEYAAIRKSVALMDAPHRAVVELRGKDRLRFLQNLLTNDTSSLAPGRGCYAYLLDVKGRVTMDLNILHRSESTLLEVDARLTESLCHTLDNYLFADDVKIFDSSQTMGRLTLLGPRAAALLAMLGTLKIAELSDALASAQTRLGGVDVVVFRNDLCGEMQYELIIPRERLVPLWEELLRGGLSAPPPAPAGTWREQDGPSPGKRPMAVGIGWSAFNIARIETGTPILGIDITQQNLPMEISHWYSRAVSTSKGCYLGQEVVARMHSRQSVARLLVGLRLKGSMPPPAGTDILHGAEVVGAVTSSCLSPMLGNTPIAMGYVQREYAQPGTDLLVYNEPGGIAARVTALPHWAAPPQAAS